MQRADTPSRIQISGVKLTPAKKHGNGNPRQERRFEAVTYSCLVGVIMETGVTRFSTSVHQS